MKRYAVLFSFLLLSLVLITPPTAVSLTVSFHKCWALIAIPHWDFELSLDALELKETFELYYDFEQMRFTRSNKEDLRKAIKTWKSGSTESDSDDLLFIYIESHGGGYCAEEGELYGPKEELIDGSRGDQRDEGDEFRETDIKIDFDGDGVLESDVWGGIDECIAVKPYENSPIKEYYWDDEVKEDLDYLAQNGKYGRLVFFWNGPMLPNSTEGCFSGGFIRDLKASNRIIITPCSETEKSRGDYDPDTPRYRFGYFGRPFVRALNPDHSSFEEADISGDGAVSIWEAFRYAWENDPAVEGFWDHGEYHKETPQLDDNGDGVANSGDGLLAYRTLLITERPKSTDINWDGKVDIIDLGIVIKAWCTSNKTNDPLWNPWADFPNPYGDPPGCDGSIDVFDVAKVASDYDKKYLDIGWAQPTGTPKITVYPNEMNVHKHQTFSVEVTITDVSDLWCYEFKLFYKTDVLNCTGVSLPSGHFLTPVNPSYIWIFKLQYDNAYNATHGRVWVTVSLMCDEPGKDGSGTLVKINFETKEFGGTTLHFYDMVIGNSIPEAMPVIFVDGSVNILTTLTVLAEWNGTSLTTGYVYIDDEYVGRTGSSFKVVAGTRKVFVENYFWDGSTGYRCSFTKWKDGSTDNPRTIWLDKDTTITARFHAEYCPGDVNGDGVVNISDVILVCINLGPVPPMPPICDVNCDGSVNVLDVIFVNNNLG